MTTVPVPTPTVVSPPAASAPDRSVRLTGDHTGAPVDPDGSRSWAWLSAPRLALVDLRLLTREAGVVVGLIGFPLATVLVLAGVFNGDTDPDFGGVAASQFYLVGYLAVVLAALGLVTIPNHLATDRELGVRRRYRASGLGAGTLVVSELLVGAVLGTVAAAFVLLASSLVYGISAPEHPVAVVGWFALGLVCFMAIGAALGNLVRTGRSAAALGNLLFVPMFLLGGGGPPRGAMTPAMAKVADVLPLTHVTGGLRQAWLGSTTEPHSIWWPVLVTAAALVLSVLAARRRQDG